MPGMNKTTLIEMLARTNNKQQGSITHCGASASSQSVNIIVCFNINTNAFQFYSHLDTCTHYNFFQFKNNLFY
jgi:ABC-type Na+ transport system ATPase subunit NatA